MLDYNHHGPHDALGRIPCVNYAELNSSGASPGRIKNNNISEVLENSAVLDRGSLYSGNEIFIPATWDRKFGDMLSIPI